MLSRHRSISVSATIGAYMSFESQKFGKSPTPQDNGTFMEPPKKNLSAESKPESGTASSIEHMRKLALSAVTSSALLMSWPAHADKYEHSSLPTTEVHKILAHLGLSKVLENKDIQVRIPRMSASGHYIVQLDVMHANRISDQKTDEQHQTIEVQKQSYAAIRSIVSDVPFTAFYPEGMTKEKGASAWEVDKRALNIFKSSLQALKTSGHLTKETTQQALNRALSFSQNLTGVTSGEMVRTLAATGLSILKDSKDPKIIKYLRALAPLGEDTMYYYGSLKYAYGQGYVQNVKGCESLEELERISKLIEEGEREKVDHTEREKKLVECLASDLEASDENFAVTTFGATHDFSNEIDNVNKLKKDDVGYIVLTPRALSWYVDTRKPK